MENIAIYGSGGFGQEVACLLKRINEIKPQWNFIGFFDDVMKKGDVISHFGVVIGNGEDINSYQERLNLVIAIGNPAVIKDKVGLIRNKNIVFPNIVDPTLKIVDNETFKMGNGNIIQGSSTVSCNVTIGNFNVLNGSVVLGHDVIMGDYNMLMPTTRISGNVQIGNNNFFGVGAIVLQRLRIKDNVRVGAGSVLMFSPKKEGLYIGNPAKKFDY